MLEKKNVSVYTHNLTTKIFATLSLTFCWFITLGERLIDVATSPADPECRILT